MSCETICVVGESGSGKSTSLRNLDPKETFIISTTGKPLPLKGYRKKYVTVKKEGDKLVGNYYVSSKYSQILNMLKIIDKTMPNIKQVIIDK